VGGRARQESAGFVFVLQGVQIGMPGERGYRDLQGGVSVALLREERAAATRLCFRIDRSMGAMGLACAPDGKLSQPRTGLRAPDPENIEIGARAAASQASPRQFSGVDSKEPGSRPRRREQARIEASDGQVARSHFVGGHIQQLFSSGNGAGGAGSFTGRGVQGKSFPRHLCCGRPLYDFGMLDTAKTYLERILQILSDQIDAGLPIVVLEPSCASVFRDELRNLFPADERAKRLRSQVFLLSEFLERHAKEYQPPLLPRKVLLHGHCHQKAIMKMSDEEALLRKMGADLQSIDSGCCGMAGPFGFEKDKYAVSQAVGERVLLPAVRQTPAETLIVSDGFSCREQILQATGRRAVHLAEALQIALKQRKTPNNAR